MFSVARSRQNCGNTEIHAARLYGRRAQQFLANHKSESPFLTPKATPTVFPFPTARTICKVFHPKRLLNDLRSANCPDCRPVGSAPAAPHWRGNGNRKNESSSPPASLLDPLLRRSSVIVEAQDHPTRRLQVSHSRSSIPMMLACWLRPNISASRERTSFLKLEAKPMSRSL